MNELALFAGAGGGILGGKLLGWRTVCAVEWEPYPASVLCARQNDGLLPAFPIWDDVQTFDGRPWRGIVDVVSGGFPCQDISAAGKGAGIDGERSGMWKHMARVVGEVRPRYVFVENSPMLVTRGLDRVLADLSALGYDSRWTVMGAADVGAPHQRDRFWLVGKATDTASIGLPRQADKQILESQRWSELQFGKSRNSGEVAHSTQLQRDGGNDHARIGLERKQISQLGNCSGEKNVADTSQIRLGGEKAKQRMERGFRPSIGCLDGEWWKREPESTPRTTQRNMGRMANGVAARVDRLKAIGNGQVPLCAATAWRLLSGC